MKTLSFLQPWADAVLFLDKREENRKRNTKHRGPLVVHISKGWSKEGEDFIWNRFFSSGINEEKASDFFEKAKLRRGGFGGAITITDSRPFDTHGFKSPWAFGPYCYTIGDVIPFGFIIPAKGQLGMWTVPVEIEERIKSVIDWNKKKGAPL